MADAQKKKRTPLWKYGLYAVAGLLGLAIIISIFNPSDRSSQTASSSSNGESVDSAKVQRRISDIVIRTEGLKEGRYRANIKDISDVAIAAGTFSSTSKMIARSIEFPGPKMDAAVAELKDVLIKEQVANLPSLRKSFAKYLSSELSTSGMSAKVVDRTLVISGKRIKGPRGVVSQYQQALKELRFSSVEFYEGNTMIDTQIVTTLQDGDVGHE